ncbi:MAG: FtsX-like permease family protein [Bacteroidota bacterium]
MSNPPNPPKWANRFLIWFCSEELLEEIQGDLYEAFYFRSKQKGLRFARRKFILDVLQFFKPYAFEKYSRAKQFLPMFKNYFKIAVRNILHRKSFTTINLLGLTIGVTAIMLISIYLNHENTYDLSIPDSDRIYRLMNNYRDQTYTPMFFEDYYQSEQATQMKLINYLESQEEVEVACHFVTSHSSIGSNDKYYIKVENQQFEAGDVLFTNTGNRFQSVFPQEILSGDPNSMFEGYNKIILTDKLAKKWFGNDWQNETLIGQQMIIQEEIFEFSGVIAKQVDNIHFDFDWIILQDRIPSWAAYTYFKTNENQLANTVVSRLNQEINTIYPGHTDDVLQKGIIHIALTDIHFTEDTLYELKPIANKSYLLSFGIIGLVILLIILTNYTNLSVAMYADRQKELAMRRVLGARPLDISLQLLIEAVLLSMICLPICGLVIWLVLPFFSELMAIQLDQSLLFQLNTISLLFGLLVLTGILSGLYPALVYGRRSLLKLFGSKNSSKVTQKHFNFTNTVLTIQFVMVIGLLSITFFIYQQMEYVKNKDLGYEKEGVIFFGVNGLEKYNLLKEELLTLSEIEAVGTNVIPGMEMYNQLTYKMKDTEEVFSDGTMIEMNLGTIETLKLKCPACDQLRAGKANVFVINKTAAQKLAKVKGVKEEELIGEVIIAEPEWENEEHGNGYPKLIGGIVEDFDYFSLKYESQPLLIDINREAQWAFVMLVRANTNNWSSTIAKIRKAYTGIEKDLPFDMSFLDDHLNQLYTNESRAGILMGLLSLVVIILALVGLIGVVSYIAYNRQKEIGIRKVLGASVMDILINFNKEFLVLIGIATLLALPASTYLAYQWLENFAFRIDPQWWVVPIAGAFASVLVIVLVSARVRNAAFKHPIEVLKAE